MTTAVSARKGMPRATKTYPPIASIYSIFISWLMIIGTDKCEREMIGTIKVGRYKSVKVVEEVPSSALFTKIMPFRLSDSLDWADPPNQCFHGAITQNTLGIIKGVPKPQNP